MIRQLSSLVYYSIDRVGDIIFPHLQFLQPSVDKLYF